jgi:hypothetical protein
LLLKRQAPWVAANDEPSSGRLAMPATSGEALRMWDTTNL